VRIRRGEGEGRKGGKEKDKRSREGCAFCLLVCRVGTVRWRRDDGDVRTMCV